MKLWKTKATAQETRIEKLITDVANLTKENEGLKKKVHELSEVQARDVQMIHNHHATQKSRIDSLFNQILKRDETDFVRKLKKSGHEEILQRLQTLEEGFNQLIQESEDSSSETDKEKEPEEALPPSEKKPPKEINELLDSSPHQAEAKVGTQESFDSKRS